MNRKFPVFLASLAGMSSLVGEINPQSDWPWWRGPTRDSHAAADANPVTTFSPTENVLWKVPVPGRGHASPTIVGNRIFLATADAEKETQSVLALDRMTGKTLWSTQVNKGGFPGKIHPKNTHASSTVACDGDHVFSLFYNNDALQVTALKVSDGKVVWDEKLGPYKPKQYEFGYGASPLIHGCLLYTSPSPRD